MRICTVLALCLDCHMLDNRLSDSASGVVASFERAMPNWIENFCTGTQMHFSRSLWRKMASTMGGACWKSCSR